MAFKIINNSQLCVELNTMAEARALAKGMAVEQCCSYLWKAKSMGMKGYGFVKDGGSVLLIWEEMKPKYQAMVSNWLRKRTGCKHEDNEPCTCGDPYKYMQKEPIRKTIIPDEKAQQYFLAYTYDGPKGNDHLPFEVANRYSLIAGIYNAVTEADQDKKKNIKERFKLDVGDYYEVVLGIIKELKAAGRLPDQFPTTYQNFRKGLVKYQESGYDSIIHPAYGNKSAAKIGKTAEGYCPQAEAQVEALIRKAASKHNHFDAAQIAINLNQVLRGKGWQEVSVETVRLRMKKYEHLITAGNSGKRSHNNRIAMHVQREAPKFPLLYWTLDGWTVELTYQDENGYHNRFVAVIVLDACTKYPIGYAIGKRETSSLIKKALRNAVLHSQQLFGDLLRPYQIQSDRYALKNLTPFYEAVGHLHTPAAVGNAKSKIIEPYFNYLNKTYCQYEENWSGFNLSSTNKNQPNIEYLDKIKKNFPDKEGCLNQIIKIIEKERRLKLPAYMEAFNQMPDDAKLLMDKIQFLRVFGAATKDTIRIHAAALNPQINNVRYQYISFDPAFASHRDVNWNIIYDENDMGEVLAISEDGRLQYILERKMVLPMDIYSTTQEHRDYRGRITQFNKDRREEIVQINISDAELVDEVLADGLTLDDEAEAKMKLMFTDKNGQQKEAIQDAKGLRLAQRKQLKYEEKQKAEAERSWDEIQYQKNLQGIGGDVNEWIKN